MSDLAELQRTVGEWGASVFSQATNDSILRHLRDEANELVSAASPDALAEEAADVLLLLLHLAHRNGFSLFDAAVVKHAVNTKRTWEADDNGRGYRKHVEAAR